MTMKRVCVVAGVGPGNGASFARRFAMEGFALALLARRTGFARDLASELPDARSYECDVADASSVARTFNLIRRDLGEIDVLIYNAGSGVWGTIEDVSATDFENAWRVNALGGFHCAKQVISAMKQAGKGTIVFIGATASRRGGPKSAAFASAKGAQRILAESMARHLWPAGVHVALVIVDGVIDLPSTRAKMTGKPDAFFVKSDDVAESVFRLTQQKRSAWSFELEVRPFGESW